MILGGGCFDRKKEDNNNKDTINLWGAAAGRALGTQHNSGIHLPLAVDVAALPLCLNLLMRQGDGGALAAGSTSRG